KKRREAAEVRNQAETLSYSIDKLVKENEDKLPEDVKTEVMADVEALKTALAGDDEDAVKSALDKLNASQTKLGEAIYASAQADAAAEGAAEEAAAETGGSDEDVVDAEIVDEDEEKK
ncbi:MAG: Hsp70 family protein, partial [Actinobacteria bacterium]|nr:Hsp70 family protein [Actinomycetota bacterium]